MTDIISRLGSATCGDRALDYRVHMAIGGKSVPEFETWWFNNDIAKDVEGKYRFFENIKPYTTSLDAALTLVPEGHFWLKKSEHTMTVVRRPTEQEDGEKKWAVHFDARGATDELSACIAALKARESNHG